MSEHVISAGVTDSGTREARSYGGTLALANFGVYLVFLTPPLVSMAFKLQHITESQAAATQALGLVLGVGALVGLVANPLIGRLSDRTVSRWGMRRPWIVGGAVLSLLSSVVLGWAPTVWLVIIAWSVVQTALNGVLAAANATLYDQVPAQRRGRISGMIGICPPLAILVGSAMINVLGSDLARFVVPAAIGAALCVLFAVLLRDRHRTAAADRLRLRQFFGSLVFDPRRNPDFSWTWLTRLLVLFGYNGVATFLPFYLTVKFALPEQDALGVILNANIFSTATLVLASLVGGVLSDRVGRRRPFVTAGGVIMAAGLVMLAFSPGIGALYVAYSIIGLGMGGFFAVDVALATQVLPHADDVAKDLGIMTMALSLPGAIAPAIAPAIIAAGNGTSIGGYSVWFLCSALVSLVGAVLVYRIKGVR